MSSSPVDAKTLADFTPLSVTFGETGTLYCQIDGQDYQISLDQLVQALSAVGVGGGDGLLFITEAPDATVGADGEYAWLLSSGQLYGPKASGAWPSASQSIVADGITQKVVTQIQALITSAGSGSATSSPNALVLGDANGLIDASWLNANVPSASPAFAARLAAGQDIPLVSTYARAASSGDVYIAANTGVFVKSPTITPRFAFDLLDRTSLGMLLEPASANLISYDRSNPNTNTTLVGLTALPIAYGMAANNALGFLTDSSNGAHSITFNQLGALVAGPLTISGYITIGTLTQFQLYYDGTGIGSTATPQSILFDISAMTVTSTAGTSTGKLAFVGTRGGLAWYRFEMDCPAVTTAAAAAGLVTVSGAVSGSTTYPGDSQNNIYLDLIQMEQLATSTSPMSAARGAETYSFLTTSDGANSVTSAGTTSLIVEGYLPVVLPTGSNLTTLYCLSWTNTTYGIWVYVNASAQVVVSVVSGSTVTTVSSATLQAGGRFKVGFSVASLVTASLAVNGVTSVASGGYAGQTISSNALYKFTAQPSVAPITLSRISAYRQALSDAQLKFLTTL